MDPEQKHKIAEHLYNALVDLQTVEDLLKTEAADISQDAADIATLVIRLLQDNRLAGTPYSR